MLCPELPPRRRYSTRIQKQLGTVLQAVVHVNMADPTFSGPTKAHLASPEALEAVRSVVSQQLGAQLESRPEVLEWLRARVTR